MKQYKSISISVPWTYYELRKFIKWPTSNVRELVLSFRPSLKSFVATDFNIVLEVPEYHGLLLDFLVEEKEIRPTHAVVYIPFPYWEPES